MDPAQRAQFQAYADGVNAYIAEHTKTLPLEFRFLTYAPHVWTVEDSLLVGLSMTEFLNHGYYKEILAKEKVLAKLGPELTAELFVNSSWRDHPPGSEGESLATAPPKEDESDEEEAAQRRHERRQARSSQNSGASCASLFAAAIRRPSLGCFAGNPLPSRLQRLGSLGRAYRLRQAAFVERHAP